MNAMLLAIIIANKLSKDFTQLSVMKFEQLLVMLYAVVKELCNNWEGEAMIWNLSQAFRKSGALRPMPRLKAAPRENTRGASEPLTQGREDLRGQP